VAIVKSAEVIAVVAVVAEAVVVVVDVVAPVVAAKTIRRAGLQSLS
jgi:hypothetical protein